MQGEADAEPISFDPSEFEDAPEPVAETPKQKFDRINAEVDKVLAAYDDATKRYRNSEIGSEYGTPGDARKSIEKNGLVAALSLKRFGNDEVWLVSGFYKKEGADATVGDVNPGRATQKGTPFTYSNLGAALKTRLKPYKPKVNENDVSAVVDENGEAVGTWTLGGNVDVQGCWSRWCYVTTR